MTMHLNAASISTHTKNPEYEDMAHVYITSDTGYVFSLTRPVESAAIEVMVVDQINFRTRDVVATLRNNALIVKVSREAAGHLDGHEEYEIGLRVFPLEKIAEIDKALSVIFSGVGSYTRAI